MTHSVARIAPTAVRDRVEAAPGFHEKACLADFAAYGACIRTRGHQDDAHRDTNGYGWTDEEVTP